MCKERLWVWGGKVMGKSLKRFFPSWQENNSCPIFQRQMMIISSRELNCLPTLKSIGHPVNFNSSFQSNCDRKKAGKGSDILSYGKDQKWWHDFWLPLHSSGHRASSDINLQVLQKIIWYIGYIYTQSCLELKLCQCCISYFEVIGVIETQNWRTVGLF